MSSASGNSLQIESSDVIRLIQQFLKEQNLHRTLQTLQEESTIALNTVEGIETFTQNILKGHWDVVLRNISQLRIPPQKLIDLYEQIVLELMEMREIAAARSLLRSTEPMHALKDRYPERYLRLEHLLTRSYFDDKEAYLEDTKEKRRQFIAQALAKEVTVVSPSRLMALLGQALKWQQSQGLLPPDTGYDLFRGAAPTTQIEDDQPVSQCYNTIKFPKKQYAEAVSFSPDGQMLATGSVDGFIEIWNFMTCKLRKDFKYQAEDNPMLMQTAVLCLSFSKDSEMLASGSQDGKIMVWKVQTGTCVRRFVTAHSQGVTSVSFSKDHSQVLSSSFDHTVRLHGLKSGKTIKEFRGHSSFVNRAEFSLDGARVVSGSSDGTVKVWDTKTTECIQTLSVSEGQLLASVAVAAGPAVQTIQVFPRNMDHVLVCNKSWYLHIISTKGQLVKSFNLGTEAKGNLTTAVLSPKGDYVYTVAENGTFLALHVETGRIHANFEISSADVVGMAHHPFSNILGVHCDDGVVAMWKP
ncbi:smu-1 suppressor of mec-8 and unc-52 [Cladochytrium replicatum]|nr:smu-1 suppressor of mec-8 and unc-52 [Cladochytrium replicatum]